MKIIRFKKCRCGNETNFLILAGEFTVVINCVDCRRTTGSLFFGDMSLIKAVEIWNREQGIFTDYIVKNNG